MGWQLKNIYLYLVTFVTLMMILFGLVSFLNNMARFFFPGDYHYYPTLMEIEREFLDSGREVPPVDVLESLREERIGAKDQGFDRVYRIRELIGSLALWLIPIPFYFAHWRRVKKELLPPAGGAAQ